MIIVTQRRVRRVGRTHVVHRDNLISYLKQSMKIIGGFIIFEMFKCTTKLKYLGCTLNVECALAIIMRQLNFKMIKKKCKGVLKTFAFQAENYLK